MCSNEPLPGPGAPAPLEELMVPLQTAGEAPVLHSCSELQDPDGRRFTVGDLVLVGSGRAVHRAVPEGEETALLIKLATGDSRSHLLWEARILRKLSTPMFPRVVSSWESEEAAYLVTADASGPTLLDHLNSAGGAMLDLVGVLAQVAYVLARLHDEGFVLLGLRPELIVMTRPVCIASLEDALPVGQTPAQPFQHGGYTAPEVASGEPADPRSDIYSVGALLVHALLGTAMEEGDPSVKTWRRIGEIPGMPQIVQRCLGPLETRYKEMAALHHDLMSLKRRLAPRVRHIVASATSIGLEPTRTTNQDSVGHVSGGHQDDAGSRCWIVACVADGMGGMAAGEKASSAAVRSVLHEAARSMTESPLAGSDLSVQARRWVSVANEAVHSEMLRHDTRGGTTLSVVAIVDRQMALAHVGDTRVYLIRGGEVDLLTKDHSLAALQLASAGLPAAQARSHPDRNTLTQSLGERGSIPDAGIDSLATLGGDALRVLEPGDVLLIASDGLWEPVLESEMAAAVGSCRGDLSTAARELVKLAELRGAPDNASVLLVECAPDVDPPLEKRQ